MTRVRCFGCHGQPCVTVTSPRFRTPFPTSTDPPSPFCWCAPTRGETSAARCAADPLRSNAPSNGRAGCGSARTPAGTGSPRPACSCPMVRPLRDSRARPRCRLSTPPRAARCRWICSARHTTEGAAISVLLRRQPSPRSESRSRNPACLRCQRLPHPCPAGPMPGSAGSVTSMVVVGTSSRCVNLTARIDPSPAARRQCPAGDGRSSAVPVDETEHSAPGVLTSWRPVAEPPVEERVWSSLVDDILMRFA